MKPKVLITREVFDDSLELLAQHCEVIANQVDAPYTPDALAAKLADCNGLMCALTDKVVPDRKPPIFETRSLNFQHRTC